MKDRTLKNSLHEAHKSAKIIDEELIVKIRSILTNEYKGFEYVLPSLKDSELDLDFFFLKLCEDKKLYPIMSIFLELTRKSSIVDIKRFILSQKWADIATQIISRNYDRNIAVKHLTLHENSIRD